MKEFLRNLLSTPMEKELKRKIRKFKREDSVKNEINRGQEEMLRQNADYIRTLEEKVRKLEIIR